MLTAFRHVHNKFARLTCLLQQQPPTGLLIERVRVGTAVTTDATV